ncbi:hypothetical protein [uncultured Thermosynechococcus sp.]|uniref:hypothetical protein n=1 Tax=uncultured Thermosynechococcus sp. TaxID=436945 RepID=UPI00262C9015|nr:hypothetical protein [uncultured Thermosynechococcus sp.]
MPTLDALCFADFGDTGIAYIAAPQGKYRRLAYAIQGKWVSWVKAGFERYCRHPDSLVLITSSGQTLTAANEFPTAETVTSRFPTVLGAALPLGEQGTEIAAPTAVVIG